jgi:hypothetical protein
MGSREFKEILLIITTVIAFAVGAYVTVEIEFMESFGNLTSVFAGLDWFIGLFAAATLFTAYLVIVAKINFFLRFLAIPLWLMFTISTLITIDHFLGYAYPVVPPKAQVMAYRMYLDRETDTRMIEAWMLKKDGRTRLYQFEWTEEREGKLKEGRQKTGEGIPVDVELREGPDRDIPLGKPQGEHIEHGIKHRGLPPKMEEPNR